MPPEVFEAIGRVSVYPAIEFVILRNKGTATEVLLTRRSPDDITWPNMYHVPGTVLRPTDNSFEDAMSRLYVDELAGFELSSPQFVGAHFNHYARGTGVGFEYYASVMNEPTNGTFFNVTDLPDDLIVEQRAILQRALNVYQNIVI